MQIIRKGNRMETGMEIHKEGGFCYLTFPALAATGAVEHLFSTRLGGVSEGCLGSMNLSYTRGDEKENVDENFRRIATALNRKVTEFVFTDQTHTANVRVADARDAGCGIVRERGYHDVDGLVTNDPGIVLCAFFADCVPLFFVDPIRRVIGLSHSGWKGTVHKIGKETVQTMRREFGCDPADIVAAVGPSICGDCYEVSEDVAEQFRQAFSEDTGAVLREKGGGKYLLDLWEANRLVMKEAGILEEHISVTDLCTCCNPEFLFSHRASHGKRGNLGAFLALRREI
ncbi:MAG: peptidoglycan editing factor PgeF [Lachnospiraceae bacterium]|nr:peptidoglycan editing factor PgeF [Lachnospiraceae bacterium]